MIVKFWNIYGNEKNLEKSHVITDFILMAKNDKKIIMKSNGDEERQFLYLQDCIECLFILMNNFNHIEKNKIIDISSFKWNTINDISKLVSKKFNNCQIINSQKNDNIQLNIKNEPDKYILNFWNPTTSLEDGIDQMIEKINKENE